MANVPKSGSDRVARKRAVRKTKRLHCPEANADSAKQDLADALQSLDFSHPQLPTNEQELQRRRDLVGKVLAAYVLLDQDLDELQEWVTKQKASGSKLPTSPTPCGRSYEEFAPEFARSELLVELLSQGNRVLWKLFAWMDLKELRCITARRDELAAGLYSHLQHAANEEPLDFTRGELAALSRGFGEGVATLEADSRSTVGAATSSQDLLPRCKGSGLAGLRARSEWRRLILRELELRIVTATSRPTAPKSEDGPFGIDGFRWRGDEYRGLSPRAWKLLDRVWPADDHSCSLDDAIEAVYGDEDPDLLPKDPLGGPRKDANAFFRGAGILLAVKVSGEKRVQRVSIVTADPPNATPK